MNRHSARSASARRPPAAAGAVPGGSPALADPNLVSMLALLAVVAAFAISTIASVDFWFHLSAGRELLARRAWPHTDWFSHTRPDAPWTDLPWLFQLVLLGAYSLAGLVGVTLLKLAFLVGALFLATRVSGPSSSRLVTAWLALLALVVMQERFIERAELVALLLVPAYLKVLWDYRDGRAQRLWLLPLMQVLWVNGNNLYPLGIVLVGCQLAGVAVERLLARFGACPFPEPDAKLAPLAWAALATIGATLINPYGPQGALYSFGLLQHVAEQNFFALFIRELASPLEFAEWTAGIAAFWVYLGIASLTALARWRRIPAADWIQTAAFAYLALEARRNLALFALASLPVLVRAWSTEPGSSAAVLGFVPGLKRLGRPQLRLVSQTALVLVCVLTVVDVVSNRFYIRDRQTKRFGFGLASDTYPRGAASALARLPAGLKLYNDFKDGGYLIWHLFPRHRIFIDGRALYGLEFFRDYYRSRVAPETLPALLDRFDVDAAVVDLARNPSGPAQTAFLARDPNWALYYADAESSVFVRPGTATELAVQAPAWDGDRGAIAARATRYAELLLALGRFDDAAAVADELRQRDPDHLMTHLLSAEVAGARHELDLARHHLARALGMKPDDVAIRTQLARTIAAAGDSTAAIRELRVAIELEPENAAPRKALGLLLLNGGRPLEAAEQLRIAVDRNPDTESIAALAQAELLAGDPQRCLDTLARWQPFFAALEPHTRGLRVAALDRLALSAIEDDRHADADALLERAVAIAPGEARLHNRRTYVALAMDDLEAAERHARRALELDPESASAHYNLACWAARAGAIDEGLEALRAAFDAGYSNVDNVRDDPDLESLRGDKRFAKVLAKFEERAAAEEEPSE